MKLFILAMGFIAVVMSPVIVFCSPERLVESSDYKDKDFI